MEKKEIRMMKLHLADLLLYAVAAAAVGVVVYLTVWSGLNAWLVALLLLIIGVLGYIFSRTPREVQLTEDMICIRLWLGKETIRYEEIEKVEVFEDAWANLRLCATTGFRASIGWFWNRKTGVYKAFITDRREAVLITTKAGKKRAFSVDRREEMIEAIRSKMK